AHRDLHQAGLRLVRRGQESARARTRGCTLRAPGNRYRARPGVDEALWNGNSSGVRRRGQGVQVPRRRTRAAAGTGAMNLAKLAAGAVVFLVIVGLLAYHGARALPGEVEREQKQVCMPLEPDPTWQIQPAKEFTLKDYSGRPISLSMYRGRVVFLNFWATW